MILCFYGSVLFYFIPLTQKYLWFLFYHSSIYSLNCVLGIYGSDELRDCLISLRVFPKLPLSPAQAKNQHPA